MTEAKLDKGNALKKEMDVAQKHLDTIDYHKMKGEKIEFSFCTNSCTGQLWMNECMPISADAFFEKYRDALVAKIAKLKKQFAAV